MRHVFSGHILRSRRVWIPILFLMAFSLVARPLPGGAQEPPPLAIPIPSVTLSGLTRVDTYLVVPWLAQYITGLYAYATAVVGLIAGVMFVVGGFQYLTAGGDTSRVSAAKDRIKNAVLGLLLAIGSYVVLATINPELVEPTSLQLLRVEQTRYRSHAKLLDGVPSEVLEQNQPWDAAAPAPAATAQTLVPAQDAQGNFIAQESQGGCPADMVAIYRSENYKPGGQFKDIPSFCIDRYEAPGQKGRRPFIGVTEWEADWYCNDSGKRLCTDQEWTRACLGPNGTDLYGIAGKGSQYIEGAYVGKKASGPLTDAHGNTYYKGTARATGKPPAPCNYDNGTAQLPSYIYSGSFQGFPGRYKSKADSFLNTENPRFSDPQYKAKHDKFVAGLAKAGHEPSGARAGCKTAEEVYDMPGNTQEIVVASNAARLTTDQRIAKGTAGGSGKPYRWMNGYWSPIWHLANPEARPTCTSSPGTTHDVNWRGHENGFRCCLHLNAPNPPQPPPSEPPATAPPPPPG